MQGAPKMLEGLTVLGFVLSVDQTEDRLSLREVDSAVEECSPREFPGAGDPCTRFQQSVTD